MTKPASIRKLLTSSAKVATLVCVGVAETACNLIVSPAQDDDANPVDSGARSDAPISDARMSDAPISDAPVPSDAADDVGTDAGSP